MSRTIHMGMEVGVNRTHVSVAVCMELLAPAIIEGCEPQSHQHHADQAL